MEPMPSLRVLFTGSARERSRSSRRDLLINLVLGGLYTSVARQHTAQYLASRTTIDGTPPAHVPAPKSRWPAILLAVAFIAARVANELGEGPPLPLLVICGVLLVPYLWGTVTTRTIGAIRWRELPLSFTARWSEIYAASWPLLVLGLAWAALEPTVAAIVATGSADFHVAAGALAAAVLAFPLLAAFAFNLRRLRLTRTCVGEWTVAWQARFSSYLRLWCLTAAAVLATAIAPVLLLRHALFGSFTLQDPSATALAVYAASLVLIVLLSTPSRAWYEARVFVLTWNGVQLGDRLRVECALDARAFARMRSVDALRTLCTLGFHRSQAVVNTYQAKLAGLRVEAHQEGCNASRR
jgi:hypothetical protein